jgi:hypothetical protein
MTKAEDFENIGLRRNGLRVSGEFIIHSRQPTYTRKILLTLQSPVRLKFETKKAITYLKNYI